MGSSTIAHCNACGYDTGQLPTGGGIRNFRTYDAEPVHCARCHEVTLANVKQSPLVCLKCGGSEVTLLPGEGLSVCPKCGKAELRFQNGGIRWD